MSDSIFVMLKKENMPTAKLWAEQLKKDGFYASIDTSWEDEENLDGVYGFRSCKYYNLEDIGYELDILERTDNIEDFQEWDEEFPEVKKYDLAVIFGIRSEHDSYIATIAATVLAKMSNGIYFDVDVPVETDSMYEVCRDIDVRVKNQVKKRKTNVYKLFQKKLKNEFSTYLKSYGFKYHKGKYSDIFYGFHDNLVFQIKFELSAYKNRIDTNFGYSLPIFNLDMDLYDEDMIGLGYGGEQFYIENMEYKEKKEIENILDIYLEEMKLFFENYIYIVFSKVVNSDYMETFISYEYSERFDNYLESKGEELPADIYIREFQNKGKTQEDWDDTDSEKIDIIVQEKQKREFPYEISKKEILMEIEKNLPFYQKKIDILMNEGFSSIQTNNEIKAISVKNLLDDKSTKIDQSLVDLGYQFEKYKYDKAIYKNDKMTIEVEVKEDLFLEFDIEQYGVKRRYPFLDQVGRLVRLYDKGHIKFGWLVAKESIKEENIQMALKQLNYSLETMDKYIEDITK